MGWAKALYIDSLYAQAEQEWRTAGMAVNSGSLMLKRCREAQKMHGNDSAPASPDLPVRMDEKVAHNCTGQIRYKGQKQWHGAFG